MPVSALAKGIAKAAIKREAAETAARTAVRPAIVPAVAPEARRISQLNLGSFDLDATHHTNFDTINTTDDVKAVIADTTERNKEHIQRASRGTITNEQLLGLAGDLNVEHDAMREVLERESGGTIGGGRQQTLSATTKANPPKGGDAKPPV